MNCLCKRNRLIFRLCRKARHLSMNHAMFVKAEYVKRSSIYVITSEKLFSSAVMDLWFDKQQQKDACRHENRWIQN